MRGLLPVLAIVAIVGIFLYARQTGAPPSGIPSQVDPSRGTEIAKTGWDWYFSQPWFYLSVAAAILATLGLMTWRRIGGWGRGAVIVLLTIAVTVWLVKP